MDYNKTISNQINWSILSLVRFFLASVVAIDHLSEFFDIHLFKIFNIFGSFEAILGFLLISGFSIGTSIHKNSESYFQRRAQRIYPVYLVCVVYTICIVQPALNYELLLIVLLNVLFLNQIVTSTSLVGPAWTLAVEVWMYALAPIFVRLKKKALIILSLLSFVFYVIYTAGRTLFHWPYYAGTTFGINLFLLSFIWIAGFVYSLNRNDKAVVVLIRFLMLAHLLLIFTIEITSKIMHKNYEGALGLIPINIGHLACLAISYYVIVHNNKIPKFKNRAKLICTVLGDISYPLYLSHFTTYKLLNKLNVHQSTVLYFLTAVFFSYAIYYIFDFYSKKRSI